MENEAKTLNNFFIMDHVWNLIKKLNGVVIKTISDVAEKINGLKNKIIELQKDMVAIAQKQAEKIVNNIIEQLEEMKENAIEMEADISLCVDENEMQIKLIAGSIFLDTTRCISKNTLKAFKILDDAMAATKDIMNDVANLEDEYEKCQSAFCYIQMGGKITQLLISLPIRGTALFIKAQKTLLLVELDITSCVSQKMQALQDEVETAFNNVNECVVELIGNKTKETNKEF